MANGFGVGPGMVTSNVVGSTYQAPTPEQERRNQMMLQRQWELQDRRFRQQEEARMYALGRQRKSQEEAEGEAKVRQAYNMLVGPTVKSAWDVQQGYMGGVKRPAGVPGGMVPVQRPGTTFLKWVRPEPVPQAWYQQNLNNMWNMWRASQMMPGQRHKEFYPEVLGHMSTPQHPVGLKEG